VKFQSFLPAKKPRSFSLVLSSYCLNELANEEIFESTIQNLWAQTGDMLVLIEPGTPAGYLNILKVRQMFFGKDQGESDPQAETKNSRIKDGPFHIFGPVTIFLFFLFFSSSFFLLLIYFKPNNSSDFYYYYY
jgi:ribosomal protein RSM22 (predicted rRNA methylase)